MMNFVLSCSSAIQFLWILNILAMVILMFDNVHKKQFLKKKLWFHWFLHFNCSVISENHQGLQIKLFTYDSMLDSRDVYLCFIYKSLLIALLTALLVKTILQLYAFHLLSNATQKYYLHACAQISEKCWSTAYKKRIISYKNYWDIPVC